MIVLAAIVAVVTGRKDKTGVVVKEKEEVKPVKKVEKCWCGKEAWIDGKCRDHYRRKEYRSSSNDEDADRRRRNDAVTWTIINSNQ